MSVFRSHTLLLFLSAKSNTASWDSVCVCVCAQTHSTLDNEDNESSYFSKEMLPVFGHSIYFYRILIFPVLT